MTVKSLLYQNSFGTREEVIASGGADDAISLFVEDKEGLVNGSMYKTLFKKENAHEMDVNSVKWSYGIEIKTRTNAGAEDNSTNSTADTSDVAIVAENTAKPTVDSATPEMNTNVEMAENLAKD